MWNYFLILSNPFQSPLNRTKALTGTILLPSLFSLFWPLIVIGEHLPATASLNDDHHQVRCSLGTPPVDLALIGMTTIKPPRTRPPSHCTQVGGIASDWWPGAANAPPHYQSSLHLPERLPLDPELSGGATVELGPCRPGNYQAAKKRHDDFQNTKKTKLE